MTLDVEAPGSYEPERRYILDVMLGDRLGLSAYNAVYPRGRLIWELVAVQVPAPVPVVRAQDEVSRLVAVAEPTDGAPYVVAVDIRALRLPDKRLRVRAVKEALYVGEL